MNSFNNYFFLIPFLIATFIVIVIADGSHSREEVVKPNEVKHGKNNVQVHDEKDKKENQSKPKLTAEIPSPPSSPRSHGLPVRSPQESPAKNWSPRHGRGRNAAAVKTDKNGKHQKEETDSDTSSDSSSDSDSDVEKDAAAKKAKNSGRKINFGKQLDPVKTKSGRPPLPKQIPKKVPPTNGDLEHRLNQHDALLRVQGENIASNRLYSEQIREDFDNTVPRNTENIALLAKGNEKITRNYNKLNRGAKEFYKEYQKTADSHNTLQTNFGQHQAQYTQDNALINSKLTGHGTSIGTLGTNLAAQGQRITAAEEAHRTLNNAQSVLSETVRTNVETTGKHETRLGGHDTDIKNMKAEDTRLDTEIKRVDTERKNFENDTYKTFVAGTANKFLQADKRMDGLDKKTTQLNDEQIVHGGKIQGLRTDVNKQEAIVQNQRDRIKKRKLENSDLRNKHKRMHEFTKDLHEGSSAIINNIVNYGFVALPEILLKGQAEINKANQALFEATQKEAFDVEEKQTKLLKVEEEAEVYQKRILKEKEEIERNAMQKTKENKENVKEAKDELVKAQNNYEKALKQLIEKNKENRIEEIKKLQAGQKEMISTKLAEIDEEDSKLEQERSNRKIAKAVRKEAEAKIAAAEAEKIATETAAKSNVEGMSANEGVDGKKEMGVLNDIEKEVADGNGTMEMNMDE